MAKIIQLDTSRKKPAPTKKKKSPTCTHKSVTAWTHYRTVTCSVCGVELDPFDVLMDMLKGAPSVWDKDENSRFDKEAERRRKGPAGDESEPDKNSQ